MPPDGDASLLPQPLEEEMRNDSGVSMALQIEQYLLEKFEAGLETRDKSGSKSALYSHFRELKELLGDELHSASCEGKSIRDNLYYLNDVLTDCRTLLKKQILSKYRIKRSLDKIKEELVRNSGTGWSSDTTQDSNGGSSMKSREVSGPIPLQADSVKGFASEMELLESLCKKPSSNEFKAIGVVGKGGIGKTTLCQLFFSNAQKSREFIPRIWASLSRQPTENSGKKAEIVKAVLFQLGVEEEVSDMEANSTSVDHKLSALVALLHKHLWGKKYPIVLDGVHNADDEWYSDLGSSLSKGAHWGLRLAHGLPKGYGGRVIVTCRNEEMARKMVGEDNLHQIMPLSDPKICWAIFENSTKQQGKQIDSTKEEELKKDIENKCAGLPVAAKLMRQMYEPTTSAAPANSTP
ncbi:probable disease resistance protein At5g45440 [Rhodamnia argentea]|uniref:Probable disease resistance protein At5g45440 n=1 Tax=Rhodamnia argentea TaxID=178133 RepID=A0A8B8P1W7_9MYRT|nr:probable disease resistance protein At5g45440 [Rhodamnia argentea]